jgi:hypothetical protein
VAHEVGLADTLYHPTHGLTPQKTLIPVALSLLTLRRFGAVRRHFSLNWNLEILSQPILHQYVVDIYGHAITPGLEIILVVPEIRLTSSGSIADNISTTELVVY